MTGQQPGVPGPGGTPPDDSTQVGMPVPPTGPGYVQQAPYGPYTPPPPPPGYGPPQAGYPPTQPGYGAPPPGTPPPGYPPAGYRYAAPPPKRGGGRAVLIAALVVLLVIAIGVAAMYAAHLGPFATAQVTAPPTRTPAATSKPSPTAAPSPTAGPTAVPTPTVIPPTTPPATIAPPSSTPTLLPPTIPPTIAPSGSPSAAEAELLSHVPPAIADTCTSSIGTAGALAAVTCTAGDNSAIVVTYTLFPDQTSMQTEYDSEKEVFAADAGSDTCEKSRNWPSEYGYTIQNEHVGRVFCASFVGIPEMYWTDERYSILSSALTIDAANQGALYSFWANESGPY
jgi:hypothetical protein